jgi:hypothetical protein
VSSAGLVGAVRTFSTALLLLAGLLPLYSLPVAFDEANREYAWPATVALDNPAAAIPLAIAFTWPLLVLLSRRRVRSPTPALVLRLAELLLPVASIVVVAMIPALVLESRELAPFVLWFVPVTARPALGCWIALAANSSYLVASLADMLSPGRATPRVRVA